MDQSIDNVMSIYIHLNINTLSKYSKTMCSLFTHLRIYLVDSVFPAPLSPVFEKEIKLINMYVQDLDVKFI